MTATQSFFAWYFLGLGGIGGWVIFFILALAAVIWLLYDSASRRIPAIGWKLAVILTFCLMLPTIFYKFGAQNALRDYEEIVFYLGLLGGVLPPVLAVGYFVSYQGMKGCEHGHIYSASLPTCPECARNAPVVPMGPVGYAPPPPPPMDYPRSYEQAPVYAEPAKPAKPKARAWLAAQDGRNFQLNLGETTIGRSSQNDIYLTGDTTISKSHAKIVEQNGHFKLFDLGSTNGCKVNGQWVRQPVLLQHDDEIQFGDNSVMHFVTTG
jgi:hypothetical protein